MTHSNRKFFGSVMSFIFLCLIQSSYAAPFGNLEEMVGQYQGEVRLQSSDGKVDRLLVPNASVHIDFLKDEMVLKSNSSFLGGNCNSKVGAIRELMTMSRKQSHVLRAVFDFNSQGCQSNSDWKSLIVFLTREKDNSLTLETLLAKGHVDLENLRPLNQKLNVHSYFTRIKTDFVLNTKAEG